MCVCVKVERGVIQYVGDEDYVDRNITVFKGSLGMSTVETIKHYS